MASVHVGGFTVEDGIYRLVNEAARTHALPRNVLWAFVLAESGGDPRAIGDGISSVGLLQLHERGQGAGMTIEERQDPVRNLSVGVPPIAEAWQAASHLDGRERVLRAAQRSGHPGDPASFDEGSGPWQIAVTGSNRIADLWTRLEAASPSMPPDAVVPGTALPVVTANAAIDQAVTYVNTNPRRALLGALAVGAVAWLAVR